MCVSPVLSERHIGLDQGANNFGIAVVEVSQGSSPNVVFAANYTDLCLPNKCLASDVLIELREKTALFHGCSHHIHSHK